MTLSQKTIDTNQEIGMLIVTLFDHSAGLQKFSVPA